MCIRDSSYPVRRGVDATRRREWVYLESEAHRPGGAAQGRTREALVDELCRGTRRGGRGLWLEQQLQGGLREASVLQPQLVGLLLRRELRHARQHLRAVSEQHELRGHHRGTLRLELHRGDVHAELAARYPRIRPSRTSSG